MGRDNAEGPEWGEMIRKARVGRDGVKGPEWGGMMRKALSGAIRRERP